MTPQTHRPAVAFVKTLTAISLLVLLFVSNAWAQSQALNGQIEGVVTDANGAAVPNAKVMVSNVETGFSRIVSSEDSGVYRVPLLPLGTYRVAVEAGGFKRLTREGVTLTTGQTATVDMKLETGGINEQITVTSDAPIADTAKIDLGRVMNAREVTNLPLVSRNPYNFSLLQANVTGRPNSEFGVPRINANGFARRTNYQLDGNNNTQTDRAGIRLMPISELFVSEVQLVTNGFAPEFGNTPGLIMNAVTPSGTNQYHGSASYRMRRTEFAARPFFFSGVNKPPAILDNYNGAIGGPLVRDKWHFYTGYEHVKRELGGEPARALTITEANKTALIAAGVPASAFPANIPTSQNVTFFIARTDLQIGEGNRLLGRYIYFRNNSPDNIGGGPNTLQRSIDFVDASDSVGVQLVTTFSPTILNELRYQYARRYSQNLSNSNSGQGLTIVIAGVANFGAPTDDLVQPLQESNQIIDNVTITHGSHTMKFGGGVNLIRDERRSRPFAQYTFANIQAYVDAKSGAKPLGYTQYREAVGDPFIAYDTEFYHLFAQDDWKVTPRFKLNYGVRYDLYNVPNAFKNSPLDVSRNFNLDKNNLAPRLGFVYGLREGNRPTVLRGSAGIYFDPPLIDMYRRGLQNNGSPIFFQFNIAGTAAGAPAFPNRLGATPNFTASSVEGLSSDFVNMAVFHTNLQLEQALSQNYSITLGAIRSRGNHLPVYRDINPINPTSTLADGRPVYSTTANATTRRFPSFNNIILAESVGNSDYTAGVLSLNKRFANGYQFSANYTWSHSIDDAPEQNIVGATSFSQSDPTNRRRDRGNSLADQRHTFVFSFVGKPTFKIENRVLNRLVNDNQLGIVATANSGENFNIVSNLNLNGDGITGSDRPLFIGRNTGRLPKQVNVDLRYSRFLTFTERLRAEVFGEFVNVFNKRSIFSVNSTVTTNADGSLTAVLPDFTTRSPTALDARVFQLGFKFNF
ncbi:MAG: TonB-dependent receptor [Blastocatellia bacterium]